MVHLLHIVCCFFFFFKQKTAYEMRISDWSSECALPISRPEFDDHHHRLADLHHRATDDVASRRRRATRADRAAPIPAAVRHHADHRLGRRSVRSPLDHARDALLAGRSEEHTSELQSLMRISYAVFCLKKKTNSERTTQHT